MKRIIFVAVLLFTAFAAAIPSAVAAPSPTPESSQEYSAANVAQLFAKELNSARQTMIEQSEGTVSDFDASVNGAMVSLHITFSKGINIGDFNESERESMFNTFVNSMGSEAIDTMKSVGVSLQVVIKDQYGHSFSHTIR